MKELVLVLFGVGRRQLLPPQQEAGAPTGSNIAPFYTLATDLSDEQIATMLGWGWVSTKWLSINFVRFPTPLPTYVATWESSTAFVSSAPQDVEDMLAAGFTREPLLSTTARIICRDKASGAAGKWGDTTMADAFNTIINSVKVRVLPRRIGPLNTPAPLYAMYCNPPTTNEKDWEEFRDAIQAHSFGVDGGRSPNIFYGDACKICHSADHSVGLCYLDSVDGWNGPRRNNYSNQPAASSSRGGRNGGRGGNHQQRGGGNRQRGGGNPQRGRGRGGNGHGRGNRYPAAGDNLDHNTTSAMLRAAGGGWPHHR